MFEGTLHGESRTSDFLNSRKIIKYDLLATKVSSFDLKVADCEGDFERLARLSHSVK